MKNRKKILIYALNALLLILIAVCFLRINIYSRVLLNQQASEFWAGESEERFAQVSCFLPVNETADIDEIYTFRSGIDDKLADAGFEPSTEGESWSDCYSTIDTIKVEGDRNSSESTAVGVGGDFFLFHPYQLVSGSYIYDDDLMKDRVVLDYELAWKLFGGTSLAGMTVTIDDKPYYVAGVVRRETDKFSQKAFSGEPLMFMSYTTLAALKEGTGISCYEIVMPDPISEFAKSFAEESFPIGNGAVVENSTRYSFISIFNIFKNFGSRSMATDGVIYPYWENAARITEVYIARLYVITALLSLFPLICLIILGVRLIKVAVEKFRLLRFKLWDAWDDRYARRAARKERKGHRPRYKKLSAFKHKASDADVGTRVSAKVGSLRRKPKKKAKDQAIAADTEGQDIFDDREIALDVESIVREIMSENESPKL